MISKDEFRAALGRFASGVTAVTARDADGRLHGITVSAFCSVSLDPPLILICIDKNTGSHRALTQTDSFVVNILSEDQQYVSDRFASYLPDKFETLEYSLGFDDLPVLEGALANLECRLVSSHDNGDHTIFVGQIERATINDGKPIIYFHGNYRRLKTD
jgi:flavin reductase (DIM6/NTAB) family NADH-FMN oxidoreductase RutF